MTGPSGSAGPDDLNFDRAEAKSGTAGAARDQCANCGRQVGATYHTVNGAPICSSCRGRLEFAAAPVRSPATLAKAITFGFGAAIAGAVIYYAGLRFLNLEIGLVAILTGWMVGKAMSKATAGRGGRLLQVSAGLLTYISVAMAYFPFAMQGMSERSDAAANAPADSTGATITLPSDTVRPADAPPVGVNQEGAGSFPFFGFLILLGFALALPIIVIAGSMPGGLISAAIIGFGVLQAWRLTAAPTLVFEGPFRLAPKESTGAGGGAAS